MRIPLTLRLRSRRARAQDVMAARAPRCWGARCRSTMEQGASAGGAGCGGSPCRPRGGAGQVRMAAGPARSRCQWPPEKRSPAVRAGALETAQGAPAAAPAGLAGAGAAAAAGAPRPPAPDRARQGADGGADRAAAAQLAQQQRLSQSERMGAGPAVAALAPGRWRRPRQGRQRRLWRLRGRRYELYARRGARGRGRPRTPMRAQLRLRRGHEVSHSSVRLRCLVCSINHGNVARPRTRRAGAAPLTLRPQQGRWWGRRCSRRRVAHGNLACHNPQLHGRRR